MKIVEVSPKQFALSFQRARAADPEIERHTVDLSEGKLAKHYSCYLVYAGDCYPVYAGFVIERGGKNRLRCMFNATGPVTNTPRHRLGSFMVKEAIRLGAKTLNCPPDWREKMYRKHGFRVVSRVVFMELEGGPDGG